ncbi:hypothetical protein M1O56_06505, partial [Dehalococcoidia bacterium]|nr:hypothetical protein [Dehalococcoidia bacterium]
GIPAELRVEPIKTGELFPKLVLEVGLISSRDFIILESEAKIILEKERGSGHLEIFCKPYEMHLRSTARSLRFYTFLTPELYQSIEAFRAGENIKANLNIRRLYLLPYETSGSSTSGQKGSATFMLKGNIIPSELAIISYYPGTSARDRLLITREQWSDKVLKPFGTNDRFIFEMPCALPNITLIDPRRAELNELKDRIVRGIDLIKRAIDEYNTTKDVEKAVDYVRRATDLLHNIPNRDTLYKIYGYYLIDKSATGSDNISEDLIKRMFDIIDSLFSISSKGPHETTRRGDPMEYCPKYEDADMLLGVVSFVYYFLSKKFERWLKVTQS